MERKEKEKRRKQKGKRKGKEERREPASHTALTQQHPAASQQPARSDQRPSRPADTPAKAANSQPLNSQTAIGQAVKRHDAKTRQLASQPAIRLREVPPDRQAISPQPAVAQPVSP